MTIIVIILFFNKLRFPHQDDNRLMNYDESVRRQLYHIIAIVKGELILLFLYVLSASLYNWLWLMNTYCSITWMSFIRWSIEATCTQFIIFAFYTEFINTWTIEHEPGAHMIGVVMLKMFLFFVTRYAEREHDAALNKLRATSFYLSCNSSGCHILDSN
jgi:hypothetical protein